MKKTKIILIIASFIVISLCAYATPGYVDTTDYQVSPDIIQEFLSHVSRNAPRDEAGNLILNSTYFDENGVPTDEGCSIPMWLLLQNPAPYAVVYKYQRPNKPKINFIDPNNDEFFCKYTIDYNVKKNSIKNIPKIAPKLPYVKIGIIKVAKKDIPYKPIEEYPYRQNYWAGARNACIANGMRLPAPQELRQIYNNRSLLGISFEEKPYWTSEEICACLSTVLDFRGINVHTSKEIDFSDGSPELKQMVKKGLV